MFLTAPVRQPGLQSEFQNSQGYTESVSKESQCAGDVALSVEYFLDGMRRILVQPPALGKLGVVVYAHSPRIQDKKQEAHMFKIILGYIGNVGLTWAT